MRTDNDEVHVTSCDDREEPQYQFRGVYFHAAIWLRFISGELNGTDLAVLALVDGLVQPDGEGCWASNGDIGRSINVSEPR